MHVCHLCDSSVEGDYFRNITAGLTRNGVCVTLVEIGSGSPPTWLSEIPNAKYFSLRAGNKLGLPIAVWRLARLLKGESVDILHTHLFNSGLIGVFTKRLHRKTIFALMRHHTGVVRMLGTRLHVAADRWMAEKADRVMTVSQAARAYMLGVDGIKRDDIEVVYLGFDFEKLSPIVEDRNRVRREFGFEADDFVVGYVGNFAPGKGHVQIIQAFAKIFAEIPKARLFFAGRGMLPEVERAAAKFPAGKVVFAGWRNDISACLNAMDVFVQPSQSEAFSQVLIEAMGVGLPVIATDVGGASEVVDNGVNGILIDANDTDSIHREVIRLFRDEPFRKAMAKAGMVSVRERFTVSQMVERQLALYKKWLDHD